MITQLKNISDVWPHEYTVCFHRPKLGEFALLNGYHGAMFTYGYRYGDGVRFL